jgi:very-short-patch-repair endonuclease
VRDESRFDRRIDGENHTHHLDRLLAELSDAQHGVVARWQLAERGIKRGAIELRIKRGQLHLVHRGVYAVGRRKLDPLGAKMAAVLACGPGAVLSHRSAGELWGILPRKRLVPEVTCERVRKRERIVGHRAALPDDERHRIEGIPVTSLARTLFDLAATVSTRELERAFHEAEVRQLTGRLSVPHLLARYPRHRGTLALRAQLASRRPDAITRNDFEERFLALLDAHGLPRPRMNADLHLRGRFYEIDCLWPDQRLAVELDGGAVHGTHRAARSDRHRDRVLVAEGYRTSRITWDQLRDEPAEIVADLRQTLGASLPLS